MIASAINFAHRTILFLATVFVPLVFFALTGGCALPGNAIVHGSQTTVGIHIGQSPAGTGEIKIGLVRTTFDRIPTGTNIYAPAVTSKMKLGARLTSTEVEDDYSTGGATREFTAKPAAISTNSVPK